MLALLPGDGGAGRRFAAESGSAQVPEARGMRSRSGQASSGGMVEIGVRSGFQKGGFQRRTVLIFVLPVLGILHQFDLCISFLCCSEALRRITLGITTRRSGLRCSATDSFRGVSVLTTVGAPLPGSPLILSDPLLRHPFVTNEVCVWIGHLLNRQVCPSRQRSLACSG